MIYVVIQEGGAYSTYWQSVVSVHTSEDDARLTVELVALPPMDEQLDLLADVAVVENDQ